MPNNDASEEDRHGPISNPVERFYHLPEPTRKWLEGLREDDIGDLQEAIRFHHSAKTIGRFFRWLILSAAAIFIMAAQFGEAIMKLLGLWHPGAK